MLKEIWKDIKGYEGYYQISNLGRVKSLSRVIYNKFGKVSNILEEKIMKPNKVFGGYLQISLRKNGIRKVFKIHRLVADYFIENPFNKREVNHIDRNVENNKVNNLEWVTPKENMKHLETNFKFNFGRKAINMYDLKYNFIKRFDSISKASIEVGAKISKNGKPMNANVLRSLKTKGRFTAYGYRFIYENDIICTD